MRLFSPDTSFFENYIDKGKFLLTWRLGLLFALVFFILTINGFLFDLQSSLFYLTVFSIALGGVIYLHYTKRYVHVYWVFVVASSSLDMIALNSPSEITHFAEFCWAFCAIIFAFIGLGRRVAIFIMLFLMLGITYFILVNFDHEMVDSQQLDLAEKLGVLFEILFSIASVVYLLHQYTLFQAYGEAQLKFANSELEYQNKIIKRKNNENSTLLKEIHHRVKNNLQIIISLLRMQRDQVETEAAKQDFSEAINRIHSMSLIHQKMYQERELSNIQFESYFNDLIESISRSYMLTGLKFKVDFKTDMKHLDLETIVPLGLLLNELITNSIKHAFSNENENVISIQMHQFGKDGMVFEYNDSGVWNESKVVASSFGQELIEVLSMQLNGVMQRTNSHYRLEIESLS